MAISTAKHSYSNTNVSPNPSGAPGSPETTPVGPQTEADESTATKISKQDIEKKIQESASLVEALECVGAMYGIPSENIVVDDRLKSIRVNGDMIYAPDKPNPSVNTKSIVCAIGAVLDNISQRIDQKLDVYQASQIQQNKVVAAQRTADPSKGEVIGRYFDSDGKEIIAYSSGLVDMDNTPASRAKVAELRASKQIPDYSQPEENHSDPTYFSDEDDIMNGVSTTDTSTIDTSAAENNIASQINESVDLIDLYDRMGGSTTMGCDLFHSLGFDYVDKTHALIQESSEDGDTDSKNADLRNIQHMRFDNTKILESIKLFNEALEESHIEKKEVTHVAVAKLMRTTQWKSAVRCLEDQFDCSLNISYRPNEQVNMCTRIDPSIRRPKLKISKSKGFQLGGITIEIVIIGKMMDSFVAHRDRSLFGQSLIAVFLHEIHHNIVQMLRQYDYTFISTMSSTMMIATSTRSVKARRKIFTNYANSLQSIDGKKMSLFAKKKMIRELLYVSAVQYNGKQIEELKKKIDSGEGSAEKVEEWIKQLEKFRDDSKKQMERNSKLGMKVLNAILLILGVTTLIFGVGLIFIGLWAHLGGGMTTEKFEKYLKEYLNHPDKEEYYCDLFAGIYNLPPTFLLGGDLVKGNTGKQIENESLKKLSQLEKEVSQLIFSTYPTDSERCYAAMRIAKNALEQNPDMDASIKSYLEWIVDNYKDLDDIGIKDNYNQGAFNPAEAENLDDHIQRIIDNGTVKVTESYVPRISKKNRFGL